MGDRTIAYKGFGKNLCAAAVFAMTALAVVAVDVKTGMRGS